MAALPPRSNQSTAPLYALRHTMLSDSVNSNYIAVNNQPHRSITWQDGPIGTPVKGAVNDLGNVIRRSQQHQQDRGGGGAYRYTHGRSERPGVCGARFRRHDEYAGCAPGAAASGSTHLCTTAATTSTTAGQSAGGRRFLALRWHWQLLSVRRRRRVI